VHSSSTVFAANQALADLIGCGPEACIGLNAWTLFMTESAPVLKEHLAKQSEQPYVVMARQHARTGRA
jgi:hypothetical protein